MVYGVGVCVVWALAGFGVMWRAAERGWEPSTAGQMCSVGVGLVCWMVLGAFVAAQVSGVGS